MTQSEFFRRLGAPLKNFRWSWGGCREDGAVFLRVWKDRIMELEGRSFAMVTHHSKYEKNQNNLGYRERNCHVQKVRDLTPCYMVMCEVKDAEAARRKIKAFDKENIYVGGKLIDYHGDAWVEIVSSRPASSFFIL